MKNIKKATIIMPVYNGEAFLRDSVRSVFRQTWGKTGAEACGGQGNTAGQGRLLDTEAKKKESGKEAWIELIAIDDGSADGSLFLLRRLARKAPAHVRMRVFTQENAGICATRNRGLDLAEGEYLFFMDQDDLMKRDYIERMVSELELRRADMLIGGYTLVDEKRRILRQVTLDSRQPWSKYRISAPWGRVFRRRILARNHIRFLQTRISEDFYFNLVYMSYCRNIAVTTYSGYAWTYRAASESHSGMSRLEEDRNPLPMMTQLLQDMKKPHLLEPELLEYMCTKHIVWYLLFTARGASPAAIREACRTSFSWLAEHFPRYAENPVLSVRSPRGEQVKVRSIVFAAVRLQQAGMFERMLQMYAKL